MNLLANYIRYLVLFPGGKSEFCIKQVKLSASGVCKILLKQDKFTYHTGRSFLIVLEKQKNNTIL